MQAAARKSPLSPLRVTDHVDDLCLGKSKRKWLYWKEEGPAFVRRRVVFMRARDLTSALILHVLLRKSLRNNP